GRSAGRAASAAARRSTHPRACRFDRDRLEPHRDLSGRESGRLASDRRDAGPPVRSYVGASLAACSWRRGAVRTDSVGRVPIDRRGNRGGSLHDQKPGDGNVIPGLRVIVPGLHSTIQDLGRSGYQDIGVPPAGALDRIGLTLANALVGNAANAPVLEMLAQGPVLEVMATSLRVALVGDDGGGMMEGDHARNVPAGHSARLRRGQRIRIGKLGKPFCAYLAIAGGFDVPPCLGSAATYTRNGLGGFLGRVLRVGDVLPV